MQKRSFESLKHRPTSSEVPVVLTIAGSDSGGGAGIQADLSTFAALRVFGTCALTCVTAQNPTGVKMVKEIEAEMIEAQLTQVSDYFAIKALKTGMLFSEKIIDIVARFISDRPSIPAVIDPVMVASSGAVLLETNAIDALKNLILPKAAVITPNLDEAKVLLGVRPSDTCQMKRAAKTIFKEYGTAVLIKGGHLDTKTLTDVFFDGQNGMIVLTSKRNPTIDTHGSGCTLAAAITGFLAKGFTIADAVLSGHAYLKSSIAAPLRVDGRDYLNRISIANNANS